MKVGLVGLGSIGRRHLGNLLDLGCEVVAFDVSADARAKAQEAYPHAQYVESLPFAGLDALVIATPIGNHLRWVEESVARKLPFFVEKALGTLEQLPRWREIAAMDLPVNHVGYNLRFHDRVVEMRRRFPVVTGGFFNCQCDMRTWPGSYGSPLLEMSHEIDLALAFGAPVERASGWAEDSECHVVFADGRTVYLNAAASSYARSWNVSGESGYEEAGYFSPESLGVGMYRSEIAHFLARAADGYETACPLADGLKVLEVCAQIEQVAA
jgi:predicted dehydrogenase